MTIQPPLHQQQGRKWGIRMDGCGPALESLIQQHLLVHKPETYTLIEIGSAGCVTLRAFADILASRADKWRAVGFDLTLDKAWSVNMDEVKQSFVGLPWQVYDNAHYNPQALAPFREQMGMSLNLLSDPRGYLSAMTAERYDFAFIDASHGISCARDFVAIEAKVAPGGLVVFHDYGEPEQGTDWQSFDREFISVRSYVHRLGLASPCVTPRVGWRFVGEIKGSRHWGGDGNSCAVVQRTTEPLEEQPELRIDS